MRKKKQKLEIKKWGESLIKRINESHGYLERKLFSTVGEPLGNPERLEIIKLKRLFGDIQLFIEKDT